MSEGENVRREHRLELLIGNVLRYGVLLAALVGLTGGLLHLARFTTMRPEYGTFRGEPAELRSVRGILRSAASGDSAGIMQLGLLLLIALPVARVAFSLVAFVVEKDRLYVAISATVLLLLLFSLLTGIG